MQQVWHIQQHQEEHLYRFRKENQNADVRDMAISGMGNKYVQEAEKWEQQTL